MIFIDQINLRNYIDYTNFKINLQNCQAKAFSLFFDIAWNIGGDVHNTIVILENGHGNPNSNFEQSCLHFMQH